MFGNKLRSWMEAVRPRKKQQRKDKQLQQQQQLLSAAAAVHPTDNNPSVVHHFKCVPNSHSSEYELENVDNKSMRMIGSQAVLYSGTNLSSPESAYSTGYSTEGTSPGAPPEYYINIRTGTRYFPSEKENCRTLAHNEKHAHKYDKQAEQKPSPVAPTRPEETLQSTHAGMCAAKPQLNPHPQTDHLNTTAATVHVTAAEQIPASIESYVAQQQSSTSRLQLNIQASAVTSPRQRNRIRTNPWLPGNNSSSPVQTRSVAFHSRNSGYCKKTDRGGAVVQRLPVSPRMDAETGKTRRDSLCSSSSSSSSSCSSLSATSLQWDTISLVRDVANRGCAQGMRGAIMYSDEEDDDDCTLNEMMGKYDESYIYEKETDILSDSDPTDCGGETDIDTGQDGGDEDDFDYIDNGSITNIKEVIVNTGHCTYFQIDNLKKKSSRKRMAARKSSVANASQRRRRNTFSKKKHTPVQQLINNNNNGTRSAGATPISVRKTKTLVSKLALQDTKMRKRSNSASILRNSAHCILLADQRDKEADIKYKELIVEAENILMNMKQANATAQPSPHRVPGPANKRVELLRAEPDVFAKNRLIACDVTAAPPITNLTTTVSRSSSKLPGNFTARFSPKRNHITNFMSINTTTTLPLKPMVAQTTATKQGTIRRSPKYRKKLSHNKDKSNHSINCIYSSSSADSESDPGQDAHEDKYSNKIITRNTNYNNTYSCPQSEPVKRKVYSNSIQHLELQLTAKTENAGAALSGKSLEHLRQQVLLNTITNLKRNLEHQSASLKHVYGSSHNL